MSRTLSKFGLPFDEATTSVQFPKALKRPRNNAGPASLFINEQCSSGSSITPHLADEPNKAEIAVQGSSFAKAWSFFDTWGPCSQCAGGLRLLASP